MCDIRASALYVCLNQKEKAASKKAAPENYNIELRKLLEIKAEGCCQTMHLKIANVI
jgi:hypothetical protein